MYKKHNNRRRSNQKNQNNSYNYYNNNNKKIRHTIDKYSQNWNDYDKQGKLTHRKLELRNGKILEYWIEYNSAGNETHFYRNDGYEYWCVYNKYGNISRFWDNTEYEERFYYYKNTAYRVIMNTGKKYKRKFDNDTRNLSMQDFISKSFYYNIEDFE